jgi:hypothetical protein
MSMFDTTTRSELMAEFDEAEGLRAERMAREANPGPEEPRTTCPECDGGGEVTWNPSPIGDPQDVMTARCPTCR